MDAAGNIILLLLAILVAIWVVSMIARRHTVVRTSLGASQIAAICEKKFSKVAWKRVQGRGDLNFQPRGISIGGRQFPVISIDIDTEQQPAAVEIWMSSFHTQFGMVNGVERVFWKRWTLPRAFREAEGGSSTSGSVTAGTRASSQVATGPDSRPQTSDDKAVLANPGLPEGDARQTAHLLLTSVGLSFLVYGRSGVADCFRAFSACAPAMMNIRPVNGSEFLGELPGQPGVFFLAFESGAGSAIAVCCTAETDSNFTTEHIAMRLRDIPEPWHWGIGTVGGSVPAECAQIVDSAKVVELSGLPGLEHLRS